MAAIPVAKYRSTELIPFEGEELILLSEGGPVSHEVWTTSPNHAAAIEGINACQKDFANHHRDVYNQAGKKRKTNQSEWKQKLACGKVDEYVRNGVVVLRAKWVGMEKAVAFSEMVGYVSGQKRSDHVHMNHIIVLEKYRGRGAGKLLWDAFLRYFEQRIPGSTQDIRLEVYLANERAHKWYSSIGFETMTTNSALAKLRRCQRYTPRNLGVLDISGLMSSLRRSRLLAHEARGLRYTMPALQEQMRHIAENPDFLVEDRFVGTWSIILTEKEWGKAFICALNVGILVPNESKRSLPHIRSIFISGKGTKDVPFKVMNCGRSEPEATLLEESTESLTWALTTGGQVKWSRSVVANGGSEMSSQRNKPAAASFRRCINQYMDILRAEEVDLESVKGTNLPENVASYLLPRVLRISEKHHVVKTILQSLQAKYCSGMPDLRNGDGKSSTDDVVANKRRRMFSEMQ
jgi:ribosomal protein S18 acetylase RimI-like enzyme